MIDYRRRFQDFIHTILSPKGASIIIYLVTLIILTVLLSSRYYLFKEVIQNGLSVKDVYSTKTIQVIDKQQTDKRKREVAEEIKPILRPAQDSINEYIKRNLGDLLASIKQVRDSKSSSLEKEDKIKQILEVTENDYFVNTSVIYLYRSSNRNFQRVSNETLSSLSKVLREGVSEFDLTNDLDKIIDQNVNKSFSKTQQRTIGLLLRKVILPNMVVDEVATDITRRNAMNSVNPIVITYKKGDKVVSAGDLVSRTQKNALQKLGYNITQIDLFGIVGIAILVAICLYSIGYYIVKFDSKYVSPRYLLMISFTSIFVVLCAVFLPYRLPVYIIPIPAMAILLTIFTNSRISLLTTILIISLIGVALQYKVEAVVVFIIGTIIATYTASLINYYKRIDLIKAGFDVGLIQLLIISGVYLLQYNVGDTDIKFMVSEMTLGFLSGLLGGVIAQGILPVLENTFKIITPYGLVELSDHNQALLRRLQFEAPGTYHHSLMVGNLAEAAAEAVGANPVLAKVGALYHDIGKLKRPLFFVENQSYFGIENPHEKLNPKLSKMIVTAHPKDGIELAKEYKLPSIIHQFIIQHHGDGVAAYFYKQALESEGPENITKEQFRYTNPKPSSKEAAILMIADAVESAVRSLKNPSQSDVDAMIDKIIKERLMDNQLSESALTQKDLKVIASTFSRILRGMQHHRIKYHENVLEELGQNAMTNFNIAQSIQGFEQELLMKKEKNKNDKN